MIWFVLDNDSSSTVYSDGERSYPILEVVNSRCSRVSANTDDDSDDETVQLTRDYSDSQYMSVSDLMIAQFFHHVVENDEAWDLSEDSDDDPHFLD